jgi:magnesium transporter
VRARVERDPALLAIGPSYGLYAVLDFIVDNFMPIVDAFRDKLATLEKHIFAEEFSRETIVRLYELKGELTRLRLAVAPMQDITGQLSRGANPLVSDEMRLYFRDVYDHTQRVNDTTDTLREMLTAAMSMNLSLVTVQQGEIVKRLAGWAGLLAAPTLITSWYGMNFEHMPELHTRHGYWVVIGATIALCVGLWALLKRAKWL